MHVIICHTPQAHLHHSQVFTGVTAWLLAAYYMFVSASGMHATIMLGVVELAINAVYCIFWLAAAAACSTNASWVGSTAQASIAFGYLSWVAWMPSIYLAFQDMRKGEGIRISKAAATAAPSPAVAKPVDPANPIAVV